MKSKSVEQYDKKELPVTPTKRSGQLLLWRPVARLATPAAGTIGVTCLPGPFGPNYPTTHHSPCAGTPFLFLKIR